MGSMINIPLVLAKPVVSDIYIRAMESLRHILVKSNESPDAASLPEARLYEDMLPLKFQVYVCFGISLEAIHST